MSANLCRPVLVSMAREKPPRNPSTKSTRTSGVRIAMRGSSAAAADGTGADDADGLLLKHEDECHTMTAS
jgi:hypothetical protein